MRRALTASELSEFHAKALAAFEEASLSLGAHQVDCAIAGVALRLEYAGYELRNRFRPALAGIEGGTAGRPDLRILIFDCAASGVSMPEFDRPIQYLIRWRGDCWTEAAAPQLLAFHMTDSTLQIFDQRSGICVVIISDIAHLPEWYFAAPLRSALAMTLQSKGVQLVHGAAVGAPEGAVLITGYAGSGKSTTALNCHRLGMPILGDDYVAVRPARGPGEGLTVHNVFASLKIVDQEVASEQVHGVIAGKSVLFPFLGRDELLLREAPLIALFSARVGEDTETRTAPAHPAEVARIAYASSALQLPCNDEATARNMDLMAQQAPAAFSIILGTDRMGACRAITEFLQNPPVVARRQPVWTAPGAMKPVSIIIPVHNGAAYVTQAVNSIAAQSYPDCEVIVVDDGSTDALDETLSSVAFPIRLIRRAKGGPAAARNTGLDAACHDWIAFLDADDLWSQGSLERLASDLILHPRAEVVHGKAVTFQAAVEGGGFVPAYHPRENFPYYIGAGLYRRSAFDKVGRFDESLYFGEDTDWFWRAGEQISVVEIPDTVLEVRMHDANMTADLRNAELGSIYAMKRRIARQNAMAAAEPE